MKSRSHLINKVVFIIFIFSYLGCGNKGEINDRRITIDIPEPPSQNFDAEGISTIEKNSIFLRVSGDSPCRGHTPVNYDEANKQKDLYCDQLKDFDIARLQDGGSIEGKGLGCKVNRRDDRTLEKTLCTNLDDVLILEENSCPNNYLLADITTVLMQREAICPKLNKPLIRLKNGATITGTAYGCKITEEDFSSTSHLLCVKKSAIALGNDGPCPSNFILASFQEVKEDLQNKCDLIGEWDIARLSNGSSFGGKGYFCTLNRFDSTELNSALCRRLD